MTTAADIITHCTKQLVSGQDRFYAEILFRLRRKSDPGCASMGVSLENGGTLVYNEAFVVANEQHIPMILVHECIHLIAGHLTRGQHMHLPHAFANTCADLAVNSLIKNFPNKLTFVVGGKPQVQQTVTVANYRDQYPDLLEGQAFEWYVNYFKEKSKDPFGGGQSDDHSGWSKVSQEAADAMVRKLIDDAVTGAKQAQVQLPDAVRHLVEELLNTGVRWEDVLRAFPQTVETAKRLPDRMKRNRRYGTLYPGVRKERSTHIAVLFDVSGSIGDDIVTRFNSCLLEMHATGCDITVVFFDDRVYKEIVYTPGCLDGKIPGGGGTVVNPAIVKAVELGVDGIICLTDGMFADTPDRPPLPFIMALLEGYNSPVDWGRMVTIK